LPTTKGRRKTAALGPKKPAGAKPAVKKTTSRKKAALAPTIADPPPVVHDVLDVMPTTTTSFMGLLQDAEVDLGAPTLEPFGFGDELEEEEEEEEEEDEEEVTEIDASTAACSAVRATNYSVAEDILLVRAWAAVGMDARTDTDQTGKRYWQRIEDTYCKMKPKTGGYISRSYRSLQGRWELMKPQCARWSAAMAQVIDAPPSGSVESDYVSAYVCYFDVLCICVFLL
jgi:hypothetical protein